MRVFLFQLCCLMCPEWLQSKAWNQRRRPLTPSCSRLFGAFSCLLLAACSDIRPRAPLADRLQLEFIEERQASASVIEFRFRISNQSEQQICLLGRKEPLIASLYDPTGKLRAIFPNPPLVIDKVSRRPEVFDKVRLKPGEERIFDGRSIELSKYYGYVGADNRFVREMRQSEAVRLSVWVGESFCFGFGAPSDANSNYGVRAISDVVHELSVNKDG